MKNKSLVFLSSILSISAFAQNVNYKVVENDPYNIKNACVSIEPFYADTWGTNITIGYNLRADIVVKKFLSASLDIRKSYLDIQGRDHADGDLPKPAEGLKKMQYIEGVANYHLMDRGKDTYLKIVLSSSSSTSGNTTYTTTKFIMVPGTKRKIFALRGGVYTARTSFDIQDAENDETKKISFIAIKKDNTDTINFGAFGVTQGGGPIYGGYSIMNTVVICGGISYKTITNLLVNTDYARKGKRRNSGYNDFYLDVLFAPVIKYKDIQSKDGSLWELQTDEEKRLGWRFGYVGRNSAKSSFCWKAEMGGRPGFKGGKGILKTTAYMVLTMGWTIPFKVKPLLPATETTPAQ